MLFLRLFWGITHQIIHRVIRAHLAALNKALREGGHHVLHQIVPKWNGLILQQLLFLPFDFSQSDALKGIHNVSRSLSVLFKVEAHLPYAPFLWRKKCHGKEDRPSIQVNLSEGLYEKKIDPVPEPRADNSTGACSDCLVSPWTSWPCCAIWRFYM